MSPTIQAQFEKFVAADAMFTSVDIGNAIKENGTWVKNSDVSIWLRNNALTIATNYCSTLIDVLNGTQKTFLYHPAGTNPDDYQTRNQAALPPNPNMKSATMSTCLASCPASTTVKTKLRSDSRARLRIPATLVRQLGLNPGDVVDFSKILFHKEPDNDLIVYKDGRISFSRNCLSFGDGPVLAFIENGCLNFEKP